MGKRIIVENDKVEGTDTHNVAGDAINPAAPPPSIPGTWTAQFDYAGKITGQLSDFVKIKGIPVALKNSESALNPGEDAAPNGKHSGPQGKSFTPVPPTTTLPFEATKLVSLQITDPVGEGKPSATAGSRFVSVGGIAVLLDQDKMDTCDGLSNPMNSAVTSGNQDFVSCSE